MGFEIERKYLIEYPDRNQLANMKHCEKWDVSQCYLFGGGRIRRVKTDSSVKYFFTEKKRINALKRIENEREISKDEYELLLNKRNPNMNRINKTRFRISQNRLVYEIDLFDFFKKTAFLEIELKSENQSFPLPDFVSIIAEITENPELTNYALAQHIADESKIIMQYKKQI